MVKNILIKLFKASLAGIIVIILGTVGTDAVDHYDNFSESIVGRLIFGKQDALCPKDMIYVQTELEEYCIDKYEVSAGKNCLHKTPKNTIESRENIDRADCEIVSVKNTIPWTNISQNQAVRACAKAGKRLPSNKEWSAAAMGTPDIDDNWGEKDCQVSSNWSNQPGLTGSGEKCFSYAGTFDMIGNVWEWVNGTVSEGTFQDRVLPKAGFVYGINEEDAFPSGTSDRAPDEYYDDYFWIKNGGTRAVARGGFWGNKSEAGQYSHYIVGDPTYSGSGVGFRCVKKVKK